MSQNDRLAQTGGMPGTRPGSMGPTILAVIVVVAVLGAIYFVAHAYWAPPSPTAPITTVEAAPAPDALPAPAPNAMTPAPAPDSGSTTTAPAAPPPAAPAPAQ